MHVTSYPNGTTAGHAGRNLAPEKRGEVKGWSNGSVRRHTQWLYSIDSTQLDGEGFAATLTIRDCPASAVDWAALRRAWEMRVKRAGAIRVHWLTEWQRRKVPHLHCAVYFPEGFTASSPYGHADAYLAVVSSWLQVARPYGASFVSQDLKPIDGAVGWLQYLSKHAARGVRHYQRQGFPAGWEKSGRLWGRSGEWPAIEPMQFDMPKEAYWRYRRLMRSWRIADARSDSDASKRPARIKYARRMLASSDPRLSPVRGVSEWASEDVAMGFINLLASEGYPVVQRGGE
jgi:hypothetical protein